MRHSQFTSADYLARLAFEQAQRGQRIERAHKLLTAALIGLMLVSFIAACLVNVSSL